MILKSAKPCPYCKQTVLQIASKAFDADFEAVQVACPTCGMRGPVAAGTSNQVEAAVTLWNKLPRQAEAE